jgi:hypothetical protein
MPDLAYASIDFLDLSGPLDIGIFGEVPYSRIELFDGAPPSNLNVPVVSNVTPAVLSAITDTTVVGFDVTDDNSFRELVVVASFPNMKLLEVVWMDGALGPLYALRSTATGITGGYTFRLLREGGWPSSPTIFVKAVDTFGNENV